MGDAGDLLPFLRNLLLFGRTLRSAGLRVSPDQILSFARAFDWVEIGSRDQVFYAARSLLVSRREDLRLFALVFDRFWLRLTESPADRQLPPTSRRKLQRPRHLQVGRPPGGEGPEAADSEFPDRAATYSADELLRRRDFAHMTAAELTEVRRLIERYPLAHERTAQPAPARRSSRLTDPPASHAARGGPLRRRAAPATAPQPQGQAATGRAAGRHQRLDGQVLASGAAALLRRRRTACATWSASSSAPA